MLRFTRRPTPLRTKGGRKLGQRRARRVGSVYLAHSRTGGGGCMRCLLSQSLEPPRLWAALYAGNGRTVHTGILRSVSAAFSGNLFLS
eukprot:573309-Amphidinium_carterae.1